MSKKQQNIERLTGAITLARYRYPLAERETIALGAWLAEASSGMTRDPATLHRSGAEVDTLRAAEAETRAEDYRAAKGLAVRGLTFLPDGPGDYQEVYPEDIRAKVRRDKAIARGAATPAKEQQAQEEQDARDARGRCIWVKGYGWTLYLEDTDAVRAAGGCKARDMRAESSRAAGTVQGNPRERKRAETASRRLAQGLPIKRRTRRGGAKHRKG